MNVEKQDLAVAALHFANLLGHGRGVAISRFTISNLDNDRRETVWMLADPVFNNAFGLGQCLAHWRAAVCNGLEPNRKTDRLIDQPPCPVRHFFTALFDARWRIANLADFYQLSPSQRAGERRTHLSTVADHADLKIIANAFFFGAFDHQILQQAVDGVRHAIGLFLSPFTCAKGIGH